MLYGGQVARFDCSSSKRWPRLAPRIANKCRQPVGISQAQWSGCLNYGRGGSGRFSSWVTFELGIILLSLGFLPGNTIPTPVFGYVKHEERNCLEWQRCSGLGEFTLLCTPGIVVRNFRRLIITRNGNDSICV